MIEILVGFGTILSISLIGNKGLAALAILALRPFVLEREKIEDEKSHLQFLYKILSNSLIIIFFYDNFHYSNHTVFPSSED